MKVIAFVIDHAVVDAILRHLAKAEARSPRGPPGAAALPAGSCRFSRWLNKSDPALGPEKAPERRVSLESSERKFLSPLVPDDNILWWKNFLKNPTLPTLVDVNPPPSLLLRGTMYLGWLGMAVLGLLVIRSGVAVARDRGTWMRFVLAAALLVAVAGGAFATTRSVAITDQRAEEIVSALLHNVYRAFDFRDEEMIYDTLAHSVTGDLLTRTYIETRRGLELASQGGARAKVQQIEMLEVDAERESAGFRATCTWNVAASVGHWGHIHQRRNQYVAELTIEPVDGVWKITGLELIEEQRL